MTVRCTVSRDDRESRTDPEGVDNRAQGKQSGADAKRHPGLHETIRNPTLEDVHNTATIVVPFQATVFSFAPLPRVARRRTGTDPGLCCDTPLAYATVHGYWRAIVTRSYGVKEQP
jgi:hypothetical protein